MSDKKVLKEGGFTLIEVIIVIAVLGIIGAVLVPIFGRITEHAKMNTDKANVGILNRTTILYGTSKAVTNNDIFDGITSNTNRIETLVAEEYLKSTVKPQTKGKEFKWDIVKQKWSMENIKNLVTINEVSKGDGWWWSTFINGPYTGVAKDIIIPNVLNNINIKNVGQDTFSSKGLTSAVFEQNSDIERLHARSFQNNNLTEIVLPNKLERIDWAAFKNNKLSEIILPPSIKVIEGNAFLNNNITKVTIGSGVEMQNNVFENNNNFKTIYTEKGAGTYLFSNGNWIKQ